MQTGRTPMPGWLVSVLVVAATLLAVTLNHWPGFPSPNERARASQGLTVASRLEWTVGRDVTSTTAPAGALEELRRSCGSPAEVKRIGHCIALRDRARTSTPGGG